MKTQSGGRGVIVMALDEGEALAAVAVPADDAMLAVEGIGRGGEAMVEIELKPSQREPLRHRRARKGVPLTPKVKPERRTLKPAPHSHLRTYLQGTQPRRFM